MLRMNPNNAFFQQAAERLFEVALADVESLADGLGAAAVAQGELTAIGLQTFENLLLEQVCCLAANRLQAEVDLAVRADFANVALFLAAQLDRPERFVAVQQAPVFAVDDGLVAQVGALDQQQVDRITDLVAGRGLVQIAVESGGRQYPAGVLVEVQVGNAVLAFFERLLQFGKRQQHVLGQTPVEEQTDLIARDHLEVGELADLRARARGGGDDPVFAVEVDEHPQPVADLGGLVFWHIAVGQQDLAVFTAVQVQPEAGLLDDLQFVESPDVGHVIAPELAAHSRGYRAAITVRVVAIAVGCHPRRLSGLPRLRHPARC